MKKVNESMFDLINQAQEMLMDRPIKERELIYHVAKLENDLRGAIIIAYELIMKDNECQAALHEDKNEEPI